MSHGLLCLIRTQDADYFLRPVSLSLAQRENFTAPSSHQPHILYRSQRDLQAERRGHPQRALLKRSADLTPLRSHGHFVTETSSRDATYNTVDGEHQQQRHGHHYHHGNSTRSSDGDQAEHRGSDLPRGQLSPGQRIQTRG
ncbi:unnamed protein product [Pleuronectes platessa]|uniref:Uncharacterized protein n=1 Tax=Pleuronectes platessa TaxID=8262 RepID=A0A9N7Y4W6_PLEPL|nr:unnamed protein product [Pleuronectes platessa]